MISTFNQCIPQSYRTTNDFGCTPPNYNFQVALPASTVKSFTMPNVSGMGASSGINNKYVVKFKVQYGTNVWFDPTGNPTLPTSTFANTTSILLMPGDTFFIEGSKTLYFETPDTGGAYLQASIWYLPI